MGKEGSGLLLLINIATAPCSCCRLPVGTWESVLSSCPLSGKAPTPDPGLPANHLAAPLPPFFPFGRCFLLKRSGVLPSTTHARRQTPSTKPRATTPPHPAPTGLSTRHLPALAAVASCRATLLVVQQLSR
jgi:hypothetical protein